MDILETNNLNGLQEPVMDTAISSAILKQVSDGILGETFRIYTPKRTLALAPRDIRDPNYQKALKSAVAKNFVPVKRLTGGRAAVFHEGTIGFAWTIPDSNPRFNVEMRFKSISYLVKKSLCDLGFDARIGEVKGEYCSGKFSVNLNGNIKVMGVGQKLATRASHIGGVIVVKNSKLTQSILIDVYKDLEIDWDPQTVGSLDDVKVGIGINDVRNSILNCLKSTNDLNYSTLTEKTIVLAKQLYREHKSI